MDYLPLDTKFGRFWVAFSSGDHAYADANHGCLAANPTLHEQLLADPADQPYRPAAASVSTDNIDAGDVFP